MEREESGAYMVNNKIVCLRFTIVLCGRDTVQAESKIGFIIALCGRATVQFESNLPN